MGAEVDETEDHVDDVDDQDECQLDDDPVEGHDESSRVLEIEGLGQHNKQEVLFFRDCNCIKENKKESQRNCADQNLPQQLPPT